MKASKILYIAALAALAACQKEAEMEPAAGKGLEQMCLSTYTTKTAINGTEIHWSENDAVKVFDNLGGENVFNSTEIEGSNASFAGYVTAGTTEFYAVYPADNEASVDGDVITVTIPADQTSKAGSFAEGHNISVAKGTKTVGVAETEGVVFQNVCSWLYFTLPEYVGDATSVTVSSNSVIAGEMNVTYADGAFSTAVAEDGIKSITMTGEYETGSTFWFVLAPVTLDGITVTVTTEQGEYAMSTTESYEMFVAQYRNLGTLEFEEVTAQATAPHVYNDGILQGTAVNVELNVQDVVLPYVTALNLTVTAADGTVVRTLAKNSASAVETIAPDSAWPYLPAGDYTVSGSYTLSGVTEKSIEEISFTVTSPAITVEIADVYTSYTEYLNGNTEAANALNGTSIYGVSAVAGVSEEILNNENYSWTMVYTDNDTEVAEGTLEGMALGAHMIKATFTFDGVVAESSAECHVTGLPYILNPAENDQIGAWVAEGNIKWNSNGYVRIGYNMDSIGDWLSESSAMSKTFSVPADVNVVATGSGSAVGTGSKYLDFIDLRANTTFTFGVSGNDVYSYKTTNGDEEQSFDFEKEVVLSSADPTIKCSNSYSVATACSKVGALNVTYGQK